MWHNGSLLYSLPYLDKSDIYNLVNKGNINSLYELCEKTENNENFEIFLKKKWELTRLKSDETNHICELIEKIKETEKDV